MNTGFDIILKLTQTELTSEEQIRVFKDFTTLLGWEPNDKLDSDSDLIEITNGHIIVEHGLEQSAVITFLKKPIIYITPEDNKKILSISYNNLIDWHIYVEPDKVSYIYNRKYDLEPIEKKISQTNIENLRSTLFDQITGKSPNPNFPTLDDVLIKNISFWKRTLAAELNNQPQLLDYSTLFNGIIFIRALEDYIKKTDNGFNSLLKKQWEECNLNSTANLYTIIKNCLTKLIETGIPQDLLNLERLKIFDNLDSNRIYDLILSFYKSREIPYSYDFAIMSKHALSRIYEHYISLLHFDETDPQLYFIAPLPEETYSKSYGSVYTPQFIARFFARYLSELIPPRTFRNLKTLDPACGSGIFLRTLIEFQCKSTFDGISSVEIKNIFSNIYGLDIDENAVQATKLSLTLLYMILMSRSFPSKLNIHTGDALKYFYDNQNKEKDFDIIIANPPYISFDKQTIETRNNLNNILNDLAKGKPDTYLGFLKSSVDLLKPGGKGLFVLPHAFLKTSSAENIREYISNNCWINTIVDLSNITVFKDKGSYVILLIIEKKTGGTNEYSPNATIIICQDFVGHALQDFISGKYTENNFYSIYKVEQNSFIGKDWSRILIPPSKLSVYAKIEKFKKLNDFFDIGQGIVTGGDNVFIIEKKLIPEGENAIWSPLIRDRDMQRYVVPKSTRYYTFYPIINGDKISENILKKRFPNTWKYLNINKNKLPPRKLDDIIWWQPVNLRNPKKIFSTKIITPHLVLLPKFSLDEKGKYLISHSPYLTPKTEYQDTDFLKYFLAVLNSSLGAWLLSTHSDKYSKGYARLEVKTLKNIPVPDPLKIEPNVLKSLIKLVDKKMINLIDIKIDNKIDEIIAQLYELNNEDKSLIGFEGMNA